MHETAREDTLPQLAIAAEAHHSETCPFCGGTPRELDVYEIVGILDPAGAVLAYQCLDCDKLFAAIELNHVQGPEPWTLIASDNH